MKAVSEFKYSVQNPTGDEWLIVNKQDGMGYKSYKVKLSDLREYINSQGEIDEPDPTRYITATISTNKKTATCSDVVPADSTIEYSTTNENQNFVGGSSVTLSFSAQINQMKSCWFRITHIGYEELKFRVDITQTVTTTQTGQTPIYTTSTSQHTEGPFTPDQFNYRLNTLSNDDTVSGIIPSNSHAGQDGYYITYTKTTRTLSGYEPVYSYSYTYSGVATQLT